MVIPDQSTCRRMERVGRIRRPTTMQNVTQNDHDSQMSRSDLEFQAMWDAQMLEYPTISRQRGG